MAKQEWRLLKQNGQVFSNYLISSYGRIKYIGDRHSPKWGVARKPKGRNHRGYAIFGAVSDAGKTISVRVHRAVACSFLGVRDSSWWVNHIDGDKLNNRLDNLQWVRPAENIDHAVKMGLRKPACPRKLSDEQVREIRRKYANKEAHYPTLAKQYGVNVGTVYQVVNSPNDI